MAAAEVLSCSTTKRLIAASRTTIDITQLGGEDRATSRGRRMFFNLQWRHGGFLCSGHGEKQVSDREVRFHLDNLFQLFDRAILLTVKKNIFPMRC